MVNQGGCATKPPRNRYNNIRGERNLDPLRLETIFTVGSPPSNLIGSPPTHGLDEVGAIIDSSASTDAPIRSPPTHGSDGAGAIINSSVSNKGMPMSTSVRKRSPLTSDDADNQPALKKGRYASTSTTTMSTLTTTPLGDSVVTGSETSTSGSSNGNFYSPIESNNNRANLGLANKTNSQCMYQLIGTWYQEVVPGKEREHTNALKRKDEEHLKEMTLKDEEQEKTIEEHKNALKRKGKEHLKEMTLKNNKWEKTIEEHENKDEEHLKEMTLKNEEFNEKMVLKGDEHEEECRVLEEHIAELIGHIKSITKTCVLIENLEESRLKKWFFCVKWG
jgi:hypothetical protein